ncbi:MAG: hypothetical protein J0I18_06340 [Actinobacteria bacterium]|nr:hypothetical protein [Actinomycetota bacterium]
MSAAAPAAPESAEAAVQAAPAAPRPSLALLGDPSAAACVGDSCAVPLR